jgi:hypothetical protein
VSGKPTLDAAIIGVVFAGALIDHSLARFRSASLSPHPDAERAQRIIGQADELLLASGAHKGGPNIGQDVTRLPELLNMEHDFVTAQRHLLCWLIHQRSADLHASFELHRSVLSRRRALLGATNQWVAQSFDALRWVELARGHQPKAAGYAARAAASRPSFDVPNTVIVDLDRQMVGVD